MEQPASSFTMKQKELDAMQVNDLSVAEEHVTDVYKEQAVKCRPKNAITLQ
jgi:hypothetical protein